MKLQILPTDDRSASNKVRQWVLIFFVITLSLQLWRIFTLNATYDQGLFLQEIWNSSQGRPFESTLASELSAPVMFNGEVPQLGYRHLAQHFTPLLVVWIPLIKAFGPWSLPLIQVSLISGSGWILFLLGLQHLKPKLAGWVSCSYFSTALVIGPTLENFHDLCIVPILVFTLLLGISKNQKILYLFPALLLPLVREDVGLLSFGIGIWMILRTSWKSWGIGLCIYSVLSVLIITSHIMPEFGSELSTRFMQERFSQYLNTNEGGPIDVFISMLKNPLLVVKEFFSPIGKTSLFIITLGLPLAFIPWLSIDTFYLLALPLFVALSSKGGNALSVSLRFVLYLVPGIYAGSIFWFKTHSSIFYKKTFRRFWKICILIAFCFALIDNPHRSLSWIIPDSIRPWVHVSIPQQIHRGIVAKKLINSISNESSVAAETHLIPQLASRRILLRFPENYQYKDMNKTIKKVDIIISQPRFNLTYAPAFGHSKRWVKKSLAQMEKLIETNQYGILQCSKDSIILKKETISLERDLICFEQEKQNAFKFLKKFS